MNWIDTNTLIAICTCAIGLTQFILWKHIAKVKAYEAEKGKNLATKEDIGKITKEIESVKASYNESLERHKIELQKEFEAHKYIVGLCNSLDNQLIKLISDCSKIIGAEGAIYPENDEGLIYSARKLSNFLYAYRTRYESNKQISELMDITLKIKLEAEQQGEMYNKISKQEKTTLIICVSNALSIFLPRFK